METTKALEALNAGGFYASLKPAEEKPAFDPDAAIARYLANRPAEPQPVKGFGRKRA